MKFFFLYQYPVVLSPFSEKTILSPLSCVITLIYYKSDIHKLGVFFGTFQSVPLILLLCQYSVLSRANLPILFFFLKTVFLGYYWSFIFPYKYFSDHLFVTRFLTLLHCGYKIYSVSFQSLQNQGDLLCISQHVVCFMNVMSLHEKSASPKKMVIFLQKVSFV